MQLEWFIFGIGALFLAINQFVKDSDGIRTKWPNFSMPSWFSYVPLFFCCVALAIWLLKPVVKSKDDSLIAVTIGNSDESKNLKGVNNNSKNLIKPDSVLAPAKTIPLSVSGLDLKKIKSDLQGLTTLEQDKITKNYEDLLVVVSGNITDIKSSFDGDDFLSISMGEYTDIFSFLITVKKDILPETKQKIGIYVTIQCKIRLILNNLIFLDRCSTVSFRP